MLTRLALATSVPGHLSLYCIVSYIYICILTRTVYNSSLDMSALLSFSQPFTTVSFLSFFPRDASPCPSLLDTLVFWASFTLEVTFNVHHMEVSLLFFCPTRCFATEGHYEEGHFVKIKRCSADEARGIFRAADIPFNSDMERFLGTGGAVRRARGNKYDVYTPDTQPRFLLSWVVFPYFSSIFFHLSKGTSVESCSKSTVFREF